MKKKIIKKLKGKDKSSAIVLGLNDALVEITGVLAGLTFALKNNKIIVLTALVTGIAASLSMASSEYLSSREEENKKGRPYALKKSLYTGVSYLVTVILLILPYLFLDNPSYSFIITLFLALSTISFYTFHLTKLKNIPFLKRLLEMSFITIGVCSISFIVGFIIKTYLKIG